MFADPRLLSSLEQLLHHSHVIIIRCKQLLALRQAKERPHRGPATDGSPLALPPSVASAARHFQNHTIRRTSCQLVVEEGEQRLLQMIRGAELTQREIAQKLGRTATAVGSCFLGTSANAQKSTLSRHAP